MAAARLNLALVQLYSVALEKLLCLVIFFVLCTPKDISEGEECVIVKVVNNVNSDSIKIQV